MSDNQSGGEAKSLEMAGGDACSRHDLCTKLSTVRFMSDITGKKIDGRRGAGFDPGDLPVNAQQ